MGLIIAKFRRKTTTFQLLERLDKDIKSIEDFRRNTEAKQRRIIGRLLVLSILVYVASIALSYFYFFPKTIGQGLFFIGLIVFTPVLIVVSKRVLSWYYSRKLTKNQDKLLQLREQKRKTIDMVMETETYKVANTILEQFAPEQVRKSFTSTPNRQLMPSSKSLAITTTGLRHRLSVNQSAATPNTFQSTSTPVNRLNSNVVGATTGNTLVPTSHANVTLPRERSVLDRMVEYLMGDGPNNRYALICKQCHSHNGMALKEDFEYLPFRCYYCHTSNPARKQRLQPPTLEVDVAAGQTTKIRERYDSTTSESEKHSGTDEESASEDTAPELPEPPVETLFSNKNDCDFDKLSDMALSASVTEHATDQAELPPAEELIETEEAKEDLI